ncbi:MAG: hypothetical protein ACKO0Z_25020 [Betaproteobacteria bacterium]
MLAESVLLVGGPLSGQRRMVMAQDTPVFMVQAAVPLQTLNDNNGPDPLAKFNVTTYRYVRTYAHWDARLYCLYVWEYDIARNPLELLMLELSRLYEESQRV